MSRRASPWWLFVLAAAFIAYFGLLLHLESRRAEPIGFQVEFAQGGMSVRRVAPGSAAAAAGLRSGDEIVLAAGRPVRVRGDWHAVEANLVAGTAVPLIVERGGVRHTFWLTVRRANSAFWLTRPGIVLGLARLTQLLALCVACMLMFRRPRDPYVQLGAWLLGSGAVFSIVLPVGFAAEWRALPRLAGAILWLPFASSICVAGILFSFFAAFPRPLFTSKLLWVVAWTPLAVIAGPYIAAFAQAVYWPDVAGDPLDATVVMTASAMYEAAGLVVIALNYSRLYDLNERRRVRAIVPGSIAALVSGIVVALASLRRGRMDMSTPLFESPLLAIGTLVMLALPISFAYAILSRRMFDFATLLRAGVRYALARRVVLAIPLLLIGILVADLGAHARMPLSELVASRLATYLPLAALAAFAAWYRERWLAAIDRRFFRQRYDAEQIVRRIISDLRHSGTLEGMAPSLVARLEKALHPGFAALMQHHPGARSFETLASAPAGAAPPPLAASSKVIALARVLGTPLQLGAGDDERLVRGLPPAERKVVSDARIDLLALVPAHDETSRQLLIAMGPKRSEEPYSATDIDLVNGVADALSLAAERPAQPGQASTALEECPACGKCFDSGTLRCPDDRGLLEPARMTRVLAQRYRLDRRIGEGGMGRLYGAVDLALDREVAVKVIREEWLATPGSEDRFRREARLAAAIGHPNIVTVFDFGVSNRTAFLVMELLHGRTLREELRERQTLPVPEVLSIVRSVGLAVGAAHARGLIHRDLKPENIWLTRTDSHGRVKVLDFGLARPLAYDDEFATSSLLIGTPRYIAPEQLRGERADTTSDCWALAVIAYELLTGEPPFVGEAAGGQFRSAWGLADQWAYRSGPRLPAELQALEPFFARALAIDPSVRPAGSTALVAALENAAAGVRIVGSGPWTVWA